MQGTVQRTVQSVWHSERKGIAEVNRAAMAAPPKFFSMVIQRQKDQCCQVRLNSYLYGSFSIINCVKQGYVPTLTLFSIFLSMMPKQVIEDLEDGGNVYICNRFDGNLFNRRLHADSTTLEQMFHDLLFAEDAVVVAHTERALQHITSWFAEDALVFRGQLEENCGPSQVRTPRRVPPSLHHHRWNWAESSSSVHLSGVYHLIRRQDWQGSREQTGQGKQRFQQTLQKSME